MLSALIAWTEIFNIERFVRLNIRNVGGGAVASYNAVLIDSRENTITTADIKDYPRWSEPVSGLVARALHKCICDQVHREFCTVQPVRTLFVSIRLIPGGVGDARALENFTADLRHMTAPVQFSDSENKSRSVTRRLRFGGNYPLTIAVQCLSQWVWQSPHPRGWPTPIEVPVNHGEDLSYVRIADIPEPARSAFIRSMSGSTVPVIANEGPVAYAMDWTDFLSGRR